MNGKIGVCSEDLQAGDSICRHCEGLGTEFIGELRIPSLCHVCGGEGKLDWLERLFGKTPMASNATATGIVCNDKRRIC
jgi:hypothetical protein